MKRRNILLIILSIAILTLTTGCNNDKLEGSNITTTIYPIEYLVNVLYGDKSNITIIYHNDKNIY